MKKKIIFFSFATRDLSISINRLKQEAINSKFYDQIKILSNNDIDAKGKKILLKFKNKRGYGYWFWKPYLILKIMKKMNAGDILHYADIGCHINSKAYKKFKEYIKLLDKHKKGILAFQYYPLKKKMPKTIKFPEREEYKYSKADLLNFFNYLNNKKIKQTGQFWAGSFFIKKNKFTVSFLKEWLNVFIINPDLVNDSMSKIKNDSGFIENRHDQSIFSILCKKYKILSLSAYECDWYLKNGKKHWESLKNSPIIAKRDLKYNYLKRFINRQIRTFRRYKNKLFLIF
jgi:hypothetical protein